ncbi:HNH endonuclease [Terrabacter sp. Root181]|uniref:HNH endonuclease n=1 Tax=Terrabacter sp. Root181 TaxID=1736484 RepID=UPI0007010857|nr:HNH endonuclease signature motif containing protein [Terrabacter sp. Root181]KRB44275.1 hypothetical protein ASD90_17945 [Terrabacter sp. Root181]
MSWTSHPSGRKARLPRDWSPRRLAVLRRDGYRCRALDSEGRRCKDRANQVDHITRGDDHSLGNLQALCSWHHGRKSSEEGRAAQRARPTQARESERHPGSITA